MENDISRTITEYFQQDDMESDKQRMLQAEMAMSTRKTRFRSLYITSSTNVQVEMVMTRKSRFRWLYILYLFPVFQNSTSDGEEPSQNSIYMEANKKHACVHWHTRLRMVVQRIYRVNEKT